MKIFEIEGEIRFLHFLTKTCSGATTSNTSDVMFENN
jgi:hypothetical protein